MIHYAIHTVGMIALSLMIGGSFIVCWIANEETRHG
jgi:hypothetical protein